MTATKARTPLLVWVVVGAVVMVGGAAVGVDWGVWLEKGVAIIDKPDMREDPINGKDRDEDKAKEVCLEVTNIPTQRVHISWHVGDDGGDFHQRTKTWEDCAPAKTGDTWFLLVEKTVAGNTACSATLMPGAVHLPPSHAVGGSANCRISGVVP